MGGLISLTEIIDVRFNDVTSGNSGPVQVQHRGDWYPICTGNDYTRKALVICRQLGYTGGWAKDFEATYPYGIQFDKCIGMLVKC